MEGNEEFLELFQNYRNNLNSTKMETFSNENIYFILERIEKLSKLICHPIHFQFYRKKFKILSKKFIYLEFVQFEQDLKISCAENLEQKKILKLLKQNSDKKIMNSFMKELKYFLIQLFSSILYFNPSNFKSDFVLNLIFHFEKIQKNQQFFSRNKMMKQYALNIWEHYFINNIHV
jgi:hypothetical protein